MYLIFDVSFVPLSIFSIYKEVHRYQVSSAFPFASVHQYRSRHYRHPIPGRIPYGFPKNHNNNHKISSFQLPQFPHLSFGQLREPHPGCTPDKPGIPDLSPSQRQ